MVSEPDTTPFTNEPIPADGFPQLGEDDFVAVDPNFLKVSLLGSALFALATIAVGMTVALVIDQTRWLPLAIMGVLLLLTGLTAVLNVIEVRHIAYQVRTHDISYRSGVLVRTVSTVPFVRVQHARISQGPVHRRFGIATLEVSSAGPDIAIRGLSSATADQLKALVVERAGDLLETS